MNPQKQTLFQRMAAAWRLLAGRPDYSEAPISSESESPQRKPPAISDLQTRVNNLEMDLQDRDERIKELENEYELLRARAASEAQGAGKSEMLKLFKKLAPLLSQIDAMRLVHASGDGLEPKDLLMLFGKMEAILGGAGIVPIGAAGDRAAFDVSRHQRMSGGDVRDGDIVKIRFVGYLFGETVLTKAMVSREE